MAVSARQTGFMKFTLELRSENSLCRNCRLDPLRIRALKDALSVRLRKIGWYRGDNLRPNGREVFYCGKPKKHYTY